jgi:hypothetical protein
MTIVKMTAIQCGNRTTANRGHEMSTQRKRNRFLNAKQVGNSYTLKPEAQSQHAAANWRSEKSMQVRCEDCEIALR